MDLFQLLLLFFGIKLARDLHSRYLLKKEAKDALSVAYLSKHGVIHDRITQDFLLHHDRSTDIIDAHLGHKGVLTDTERARLEDLRVYLLVQWQMLLDEIQSTGRNDHEAMPTLRQRDREVVEENHFQWSILLTELRHVREQLQNISLLPVGTSRQSPR